jgi:glycosyltransferase involved in cell wall biosynthesis
LKICVTIKTLGLGGAEVLLTNVLTKLVNLNYDITVCYFNKEKDFLVPNLLSENINVEYIGELTPKEFIKTYTKYKQFLLSNQFYLIFDHSPMTSLMSRLAKNNQKIVYMEHNVWSSYNMVTKLLNRLTYGFIDKVICVSQQVYNSNGRNGMVLDNAIDVIKFKNRLKNSKFSIREELDIEVNKKLIVSVANVSHRKNHMMMVKAFIKADLSDAFLLIIGQKKNAYDEVSEFIEKQNCKNICLYGPSDNVAHILSEADIFCLTSYQEGLPISLLESMSFGVVPICTPAGGIPSVITNDIGRLVDYDDTESLASSFREVALNDELRSRLAKRCSDVILEKYDIDNYVNKLVEQLE